MHGPPGTLVQGLTLCTPLSEAGVCSSGCDCSAPWASLAIGASSLHPMQRCHQPLLCPLDETRNEIHRGKGFGETHCARGGTSPPSNFLASPRERCKKPLLSRLGRIRSWKMNQAGPRHVKPAPAPVPVPAAQRRRGLTALPRHCHTSLLRYQTSRERSWGICIKNGHVGICFLLNISSLQRKAYFLREKESKEQTVPGIRLMLLSRAIFILRIKELHKGKYC